MIIRRQHNSGYRVMPNKLFNDERLSIAARGLMGYLLAKPDHWQANVTDIQKRCGVGRDKAYKMVRELIDAGYVDRRATRDSQGRITGHDYIVFDCPEDNPHTENQYPLPDLPDTDLPDTANQHAYRDTDSEELLSSSLPPYIPPDRFSEFWDVFPKKVGKKAAQKIWDRHMKAKVSPDEIIEGARRYAFAVVGEERGFIKHPQGWLNDERWRDDPEMVKPPDKPGAALDALDASIAKAKENGNSSITDSDSNRDRREHFEGDESLCQSGPPAGISQRDYNRLAKQIGFAPRFAGDGEEHSRE